MPHSICYVSTATTTSIKEIEELLDFCYTTNNRLNIKGLLLFSEGNFLQVLEGDKKKVLRLYEKIKKDPRHKDIIQVVGRDVTQQAIDGYKVQIVDEGKTFGYQLPEEYRQPLIGMNSNVRNVVERMVINFISI